MARGGRRTYTRDSRGRFASTPGGGLGAARKAARSQSGRTSTLAARSSLKRSRAKLAAKDRADETLQGTLSTRAQKGAVTRGNRKLAGAKVAAQTRIARGAKGVVAKQRKTQNRQPSGSTGRPAKPIPKINTNDAIKKAIKLRERAQQLSRQAESMMGGGRKDSAIVNAPIGSRARKSAISQGIKGSQVAARADSLNKKAGRILDRAIASRKKAEKAALKPPKKQRSPESLRISRAKQIEKRRSINISNPAGKTSSGAAILAANAAKTQARALQFYKGQTKSSGLKTKPTTSAPNLSTINSSSRAKGSRTRLPGIGGTIAKPKGLKPGGIGKSKALKAKNDELRAQRERTKKAAASSAKRSKPVDTLTFQGGGIKGPTGAVLKAYTWQWQWGSRVNREGDEVSKRVSNWDAAVRSDSSGKNVVHQFVLEKNGNRSVVSAEGALKDLGFMGDSAKRFGSLKSSLKTYARLRMQQSELERQKEIVNKINEAKRIPRIKVSKIIGPGAEFQGWSMSAGKTKVVSKGGLWGPEFNPDALKPFTLTQYRRDAVIRATGKTPELISQELRDVTNKIKRMEKKINSQTNS